MNSVAYAWQHLDKWVLHSHFFWTFGFWDDKWLNCRL